MSAQDGPRPLGDVFADLIEQLLRLLLDALPDDGARKRMVMALRERGWLTDETTALAFMWHPGMRDA